ncbi:CD209 antigen-like isoform X2 [Hyla sarda]|uniref:CD209 antigen-like isoform X2 n=1 Tax=Hyla sarda TaxID=327740 RepID=UPI0024C3721E|nr:CD209 antigen-like isoform X2 [Hyla sarda]
MEGAVYADLMFQSHEVRDQETLRMDDRENMKEDMSCTSEKNLGSPFLRRLLVGSLLLVVALFTLTVTLLSYYLPVSSHLRSAEAEAESLRRNSSHWLDEREMAQNDAFQMQKNLSSVQREYSIVHDILLPRLLYNQTQHQRALQAIERQRKDVRSDLRKIQEHYGSLRKRNILIPRSSDLLRNCIASEHDSAMLCPFCPPGWTLFETSCYLHSAEDARSWGESLPWCRVQGGHLVVINDEEEQNFLESLVNDTIWIGLSDYHREGNWRWVDGTPYDSTTWCLLW